MEKYKIEERERRGGVQKIYRFENNYGASVVRHDMSYGSEDGLWEIGVIKFDSKENDIWQLCYDTSVTNDVLGWLSDVQVEETLKKIKELSHI